MNMPVAQKNPTPRTTAKVDTRIVVLHRGWVVIGNYKKVGKEIEVHKASVIRIFGTNSGLGGLYDGPTKNTVLDKCHGIVRAHELAVVMTIDVDAKAWKAVLS
jgi:hypothetical protein